MIKDPYSVLMSVYEKENPAFFEASIESILNQTAPPDDFVIVCDGLLTAGLNEVLTEKEGVHAHRLHIVRLEKNVGLGRALNAGLKQCRNELVARMDSDDIALPDRMEKQLAEFEKDEDLVVCGGQIEEFEENVNLPVSGRSVPCGWEEIKRYGVKRNPLNHMTVMFKKSHVIATGGYRHMVMAEDYDLWARMMMAEHKMCNLPDVLVMARVGNGMVKRRGGFSYCRQVCALQKELYRIGFISKPQYCKNIMIRCSVSLMPSFLRKAVYHRFLRK